MKFAFTFIVTLASIVSVSAANVIPRLECAEASRFGIFSITPDTVNRGDTVTISANFECAVENFGIEAQFLDYTIQAPNQPTVVLARREVTPGILNDTFTTTIPRATFFVPGNSYSVLMTNTYAIPDVSNGAPVLVQGGIFGGITISG